VGLEIERKFLVADPTIVDGLDGVAISQAYLLDDPTCVIRVRRAGDRGFVTIKGEATGITRPEYEYGIPLVDANTILATMGPGRLVEKTRYRLPDGKITWEIDVFGGANTGLVVAEVELTDEKQVVSEPGWLGPEVTDDPRYLNVNLARHPFRDWSADDSPTASRLPIDGLGDISLADLLGQAGCPLCRLRRDSTDRYLRALLWEGVNDISFRERLTTGRGFCRKHAHAVLAADRAQSGGSLGAAILLGSALRARLAELRRLPASRTRRARDAVRAASEAPDCPVCGHVAAAERMTVDRLLARLADPAWREAMASADLCLDDLLRMWTTAIDDRNEHWPEMAAAQLARIEQLVRRLDSFAHHSSHDRRHLLTDSERGAGDEAAAFLGGGS
jgi:CYTH domain-containing protein